VVVWFTARNDVVNNVFATSRSGAPKPTFWLEGGALRGPTEPWLGRVGPWLKLGILWRRCFPDDRADAWERRLPPPYQPLPEYAGEVNREWQTFHDRGASRRRLAHLATEHITHVLRLTPRSARTQYGLDLTRSLFREIAALVRAHGGRFFILKEDRPWEQARSEAAEVYVCDDVYLATSTAQYHENLDYLFRDLPVIRVPLPATEAELSATDNHLNAAAIDFVFRRLAPHLTARRAPGAGAGSLPPAASAVAE
jgi:hypothetical protein